MLYQKSKCVKRFIKLRNPSTPKFDSPKNLPNQYFSILNSFKVILIKHSPGTMSVSRTATFDCWRMFPIELFKKLLCQVSLAITSWTVSVLNLINLCYISQIISDIRFFKETLE